MNLTPLFLVQVHLLGNTCFDTFMKKIFILLATALMAVACVNGTVHLTGKTNAEVKSLGGATIILTNLIDNTKLDPIRVSEDGTFSATIEANKKVGYSVSVEQGGFPIYKNIGIFIPEGGDMHIDFSAGQFKVEGGKLFENFTESKSKVTDTEEKIMQELTSAKIELEAADYASFFSEKMKEYNDVVLSVVKKNAKNFIGYYFFNLAAFDVNLIEDIDTFNKYYKHLDKYYQNLEQVVTLKEQLASLSNTSEGAMFKDFEGKDPEGNPVKLSDYVGKGKYVLVDFWASWCGPCKQELPNVASLYNTFNGDNFTVLGVAVWDQAEASKQTMEQYEMTWNQIFVGDDKTPTDIYGINGIPHIILFGPDGKIIKRNLRGTEMISFVIGVLRGEQAE